MKKKMKCTKYKTKKKNLHTQKKIHQQKKHVKMKSHPPQFRHLQNQLLQNENLQSQILDRWKRKWVSIRIPMLQFQPHQFLL